LSRASCGASAEAGSLDLLSLRNEGKQGREIPTLILVLEELGTRWFTGGSFNKVRHYVRSCDNGRGAAAAQISVVSIVVGQNCAFDNHVHPF
jgi:hypothetical protein